MNDPRQDHRKNVSNRDEGASHRRYSPLDQLLMRSQRGLDVLAGAPRLFAKPAAQRSDYPAAPTPTAPLDDAARRHAAGLMRVNHAGEIAAQALYRGQALVARDPAVREQLMSAAEEERAHLEWCETRLAELGEKPSRLAPVWYATSVAIGAGTALAGDRVSLGFVAETERQVVEHLEEHLSALPKDDQRSRVIVRKMRDDEARHGADATAAGAMSLPPPVKSLMAAVAKVMKRGAYRW